MLKIMYVLQKRYVKPQFGGIWETVTDIFSIRLSLEIHIEVLEVSRCMKLILANCFENTGYLYWPLGMWFEKSSYSDIFLWKKRLPPQRTCDRKAREKYILIIECSIPIDRALEVFEAACWSHGSSQCCAEPYQNLRQKEYMLHVIYNYLCGLM